MEAEKAFKKLSVIQRLSRLKKNGQYVGSRFYSAYHIHLYVYEGLFIEVWFKLGLNLIHWIDVQKSEDVLHQYTEKVDIYNDLGLDSGNVK